MYLFNIIVLNAKENTLLLLLLTTRKQKMGLKRKPLRPMRILRLAQRPMKPRFLTTKEAYEDEIIYDTTEANEDKIIKVTTEANADEFNEVNEDEV